MVDAIVVGTGATGAWAAKILAESGLKILVLDGGPQRLRQPEDGHVDLAARRLRQPIQSQHYAWPADPDSFVDDVDCPYTSPTGFQWIRSRQVGGRMVVPGHGHRFLPLTDREFFAAREDGFGESWPIGSEDLAAHFERVQQAIATCEDPASRSMRWMRRAFDDEGKPWRFRTDGVGLPPQALPQALATGNATLLDNTIVSHVLVDPSRGRALGVACVDRLSGRTAELPASRVLLCASAIESTRILMNSGIANSSGLLGSHLMDHVATSVRARYRVGRVPSLLFGRSHRAYLEPFFDSSGKHRFLRGYGIQIHAGRGAGGYVDVSLDAFGEMLPQEKNRVSLHPTLTDRWGIPSVNIDCAHSENELRMAEDQLATMRRLAAGAESVEVHAANAEGRPRPPGRVNHEAGTARMGVSRTTSVLQPNNETWDVRKLYVLDAACFASQGHQNPTFTMLAIADRACRLMMQDRSD